LASENCIGEQVNEKTLSGISPMVSQ